MADAEAPYREEAVPEGRILVTGSTGFVGRHAVGHLLALGRPLTLIVRG